MARRTYFTDLSDAQWMVIMLLLPKDNCPGKPGRPVTVDRREIINGILYISRTGCQWRMLPSDFPHWKTVYTYFRLWRLNGTWQRIHGTLRTLVRITEGRDPTPSAGIIDSQTVKVSEVSGVRGYDAGKKIKGRKRHIVVDTIGLVLAIVVHAANIQDRDGAKLVFMKLVGQFPRLQLVWADGGYAGKLISWVQSFCCVVLEIVKRSAEAKGFQILPRRWVVERTFGWFGRYRRLSKDYEVLTETSETMIQIAMIHLMIRRLTAG